MSEGNPNAGESFADLFSAQAWFFVYFLNRFENGKYREAFLNYARLEFSGDGGRPGFRKAFGLKLEVNYEPIEKEYLAYLREVFFE